LPLNSLERWNGARLSGSFFFGSLPDSKRCLAALFRVKLHRLGTVIERKLTVSVSQVCVMHSLLVLSA
jgi:hypothetical protein